MDDYSLLSDTVGEILDTGFLVQWNGINPGTGEAWKPIWICRDECPAELVARWKARKENHTAVAVPQHTVKRSASSVTVIDSEPSVTHDIEQSCKKPKLDGKAPDSTNISSGHPTYPGFRPFNQKPKPKAKLVATTRRNVMPYKSTAIPAQGTDSPEEAGSTVHWMLDPVIATKSNMTVVITGSGGHERCGWHNGEYEGESGVVLSVFNTGNVLFASTAQVKVLEPREGAPSVFAIPVNCLSPVRPGRPGEKALLLDGEYKGEVAIIREEGTMEGEWFVSVRNNHFEICAQKLVLHTEVTDTM